MNMWNILYPHPLIGDPSTWYQRIIRPNVTSIIEWHVVSEGRVDGEIGKHDDNDPVMDCNKDITINIYPITLL